MNCKVEYFNNKENDILIRTFNGTVSVDDIFESWKNVIDEGIICKTHKGVISDFRESELEIDESAIEVFQNYYSNNIEFLKSLKLAQIIDSPSIAFPLLLQNKGCAIEIRPFSTIEAAVNWIRL